MISAQCIHCKRSFSRKLKVCPFCGTPDKEYKSNRIPKWYQKTSVSLSIAAVLLIIVFGFIHIITGVRTRFGLSYDIALKQSFGFKETLVNAKNISSIPYVTAKIKYPKSCKVLQRLGYIDSGQVFETAMKDSLVLKFKSWISEFRLLINNEWQNWQYRLRGETDDTGSSSRDAQSYNNRGIAAAKQNEFETAISEFSRAINRDPTFADSYYNRALVHEALGHIDNAVSDYTKVTEINPMFPESYINRGQIYLARGQYDQAITDFAKVIEIDLKYAEAYFSRSLANFALGDYDKVSDDVRKIESLGYSIPDDFMMTFRKISK
jgi:tetratricopeptide (TPR) repeat protein